MKNSQKNKTFLKLKSFNPVLKNNWVIKFSTYDDHVLLVILSMMTGQTIIRYFDNEDGAVQFINFVLLQDASEDLPFL
jgi:hypothetical protein